MKDSMNKKLAVQAIFNAARTTVDGGWRITFDLAEHEAAFVTELTKIKTKALYLVVVESENANDLGDETELRGLISEEDGLQLRDED